MTILPILGLLGLILGLAYVRAKLLIWVVAMGLLTALYVLLPQINVGVAMVNSVITAGLILLCIGWSECAPTLKPVRTQLSYAR